MSKNLFNDTISVCNVVESILDSYGELLSTFTSSGTLSYPTNTGDSLFDYDNKYPTRYSDNSTSYWSNVVIPKTETPKYPVSNMFMLEDGTTVIEIAVTGFSKEEISVDRNGDKIIVTGKKEGVEEDDRKYSYHNISEKDFKNTYRCSDKQDLDSADITLENGKLTLSIPLKEESKPIIKSLKIK